MTTRCELPVKAAPQRTDHRPAAKDEGVREPHALRGNDGIVPGLDGDLWVETISPHDLPGDVGAAWDDLAGAASSPNVFYERWNLLPAVEQLTPHDRVELVLVFRRSKNPAIVPRLCGLFPLCRSRCSRLPLSAWKLWGHHYGYLQTPLIRRGQEQPVLDAFLDWATSIHGGPGILHWSLLDGEGPVAHALSDVLVRRNLVHFSLEHRTRALLRRMPNWEDAAAASLSSHHRRELRRQQRRLSELGVVTVRTTTTRTELSVWQEAFLRLEDSGWKGAERTSLAAEPRSRQYFLDFTAAAQRAGKLQMIGLFLDDEPIALRVGMHSGAGSFAWKIAYDERYAKYSPGVQLEIENIRIFHEERQLQWMDSCASTQHFMINRLWSDRRAVQHQLISLGGRLANLAVAGLPLARALKRSLQRKSNPAPTGAEDT